MHDLLKLYLENWPDMKRQEALKQGITMHDLSPSATETLFGTHKKIFETCNYSNGTSMMYVYVTSLSGMNSSNAQATASYILG